MKAKLLISALISAASIQYAHAANITNNITGVGPKDNPINPYLCIKGSDGTFNPVAPGQTVDGNAISGNAYYVGGALRFGVCSDNDSYIGYVNISLNDQGSNSVTSFNGSPGTHIAYVSYAIDNKGSLTGNISYSPAIKPNFNLLAQAPAQNANWDFVGINLSGLEFDKVINPTTIPNLSVEDASTQYTDLADTTAFLQAGMNTIRIPVSWGYLQLDGPG